MLILIEPFWGLFLFFFFKGNPQLTFDFSSSGKHVKIFFGRISFSPLCQPVKTLVPNLSDSFEPCQREIMSKEFNNTDVST